MGSGSYRRSKIADFGKKWMAFQNFVTVYKLGKVATWHGTSSPRSSSVDTLKLPKESLATSLVKVIPVAAGERIDQGRLPTLDFKILEVLPVGRMGDLMALDEAMHHMGDLLPAVRIHQALVSLKPGRAVSVHGTRMRPAMVVAISSDNMSTTVLLDVERSGISALSFMALQFHAATSPDRIEASVKCMLDGFVDRGLPGYWSTGAERHCASDAYALGFPNF